jgi:hypothetical protein
MGSALVLVCAIGCTLVAAYQWAARVGAFGATSAVLAVQDWQGRAWSTALAIILWLVWLVLHLGNIHAPRPTW